MAIGRQGRSLHGRAQLESEIRGEGDHASR